MYYTPEYGILYDILDINNAARIHLATQGHNDNTNELVKNFWPKIRDKKVVEYVMWLCKMGSGVTVAPVGSGVTY